MGHYWYDFLDRKYPTRTIYSILHKVLYDQILAAPVFNIVFIFGIHFLETKNLQEIIDAVKSKFLIIYTVNIINYIKKFSFYIKLPFI
jgi:protein Mpv17